MEVFYNVEKYKQSGGCYQDDRLKKLPFIEKQNIPINDIIKSSVPLIDKYHFLISCCLSENEFSILYEKVLLITNKIYQQINTDNKIGDIMNVFVEISKLKEYKSFYIKQLDDLLINFVNENS